MYESRQPRVAVDLDRGHQVETKQCEVRKIVVRQGLVLQMSVYAPEPAKASRRHARATEIRQFQLFRRPDHNVLDLALSVEKDAYLAARLVRKLGHLTRKFGRDDLTRLDTPRGQTFNATQLIVFEAPSKPVNSVNKPFLRLSDAVN